MREVVEMADVYKVTAHMAWGGLGGRPWRNTFEFNYGGGDINTQATNEDDITPSDFVFTPGWEAPMVEFLRTLHLTPVYIDRITVSTWRPDTRISEGDLESYDAQEIAVFPVGLYGQRTLGAFSNALDLEQTLFIRRLVLSGRLGRLNLRGVLTQADVETNSQGKTQLRSDSEVGPGGDRWTDAYAVFEAAYINADVGFDGLRNIMFGWSADGTGDGNMRAITSMAPAGVTSVNLTKRNKAPDEAALLAKAAKLAAKKVKGS
jgi:hypothetical protein